MTPDDFATAAKQVLAEQATEIVNLRIAVHALQAKVVLLQSASASPDELAGDDNGVTTHNGQSHAN